MVRQAVSDVLRRCASGRRWCAAGALATALGLGGHGTAHAETTIESESESESGVDRFVGDYVHAGGQRDIDGRDAAIEELITDFNVVLRPIARKKLRDGNPIAKALEITVDGDLVTVAFDGKNDVANLDGTKTKIVGIQGDSLDYSVNVNGSRLRQVYSGERGGRSNEIRVRSGGALKIAVEMTSSRLPRPLRYTLRYRPR